MRVEGNIVDIENREIFQGSIEIKDGRISSINRHVTDAKEYITLGFIDAHVHIESSMLTPANFGQLVVSKGTIATVSDPHEIANVLGVEGIEFMLEDSKISPIKSYFTIPSSVPATDFDSPVGRVTASDVEQLAQSGRFIGLSEMMNIPGVLLSDSEVMAKIASAKSAGIAIDGHAPMLSGSDLERYIAYGISTDHESSTLCEAQEKISLGMKIIIRQGSAAKNYHALRSLIESNTDMVMFGTDDSHPDDIITHGHIDKIVRAALEDGLPLFDILQAASINPIEHYGLDLGRMRVGDRADLIVVDNLSNFKVERVYIEGELRFNRGCKIELHQTSYPAINNFNLDEITLKDLAMPLSKEAAMIGLIEDEIITKHMIYMPKQITGNFESDLSEDVIKLVYINRYFNGTPQVALCHGFGMKRGAIASTISHDSHNIIAAGCNDRDLATAINTLIKSKGGLAATYDNSLQHLPLPIAGIISDKGAEEVATEYIKIQKASREMGCTLHSPFMTLSFLALIVVPELKISERGLFSYSQFNWLE